MTDKALEIIDDNLEQPFLLSLCYYTVHTPIEGKPELVERYAARVQEHAVHTNPDYAAMVHSLDENVGRVLARLDKHGLAEQTIVMFLSDNGGYINDGQHHPGRATTSNRPLRSGKGSLYEGGIRVPWIVRWPGVAPAGGVCRNPVTTCDLYPTLLRGVGLNLPAGQVLDGLDVIGSIRAPEVASGERDLFFHYPHYYATTTPVSAIRSGSYKLLEYFEDSRLELYDLQSDLSENHNLAGEQPEIAARLQARLNQWRREVHAALPEHR